MKTLSLSWFPLRTVKKQIATEPNTRDSDWLRRPLPNAARKLFVNRFLVHISPNWREFLKNFHFRISHPEAAESSAAPARLRLRPIFARRLDRRSFRSALSGKRKFACFARGNLNPLVGVGGFLREARLLESAETAVEGQVRRIARLSLLPPDQLDADLDRPQGPQPQSQRHQRQIG